MSIIKICTNNALSSKLKFDQIGVRPVKDVHLLSSHVLLMISFSWLTFCFCLNLCWASLFVFLVLAGKSSFLRYILLRTPSFSKLLPAGMTGMLGSAYWLVGSAWGNWWKRSSAESSCSILAYWFFLSHLTVQSVFSSLGNGKVASLSFPREITII